MNNEDDFKVNFEIINLDELKQLIAATLESVEVLNQNLEKINKFELQVTQKSV